VLIYDKIIRNLNRLNFMPIYMIFFILFFMI